MGDDVTVIDNLTIAIERIVVVPIGASVNDERATRVSVDDEGAGAFVVVEQESGSIRVDPDEWPALRAAIERMILVARGLG